MSGADSMAVLLGEVLRLDREAALLEEFLAGIETMLSKKRRVHAGDACARAARLKFGLTRLAANLETIVPNEEDQTT